MRFLVLYNNKTKKHLKVNATNQNSEKMIWKGNFSLLPAIFLLTVSPRNQNKIIGFESLEIDFKK